MRLAKPSAAPETPPGLPMQVLLALDGRCLVSRKPRHRARYMYLSPRDSTNRTLQKVFLCFICMYIGYESGVK